jgi:recombinational DNA repair protein RecR
MTFTAQPRIERGVPAGKTLDTADSSAVNASANTSP